MADKPIPFSAPMIKALLDGRKTQTRRILKEQPSKNFILVGVYAPGLTAVFEDLSFDVKPDHKARILIRPGDRLWVRETWQALSYGDYKPTKTKPCDIRYAATDPLADSDKDVRGYPWRPSIHMNRWASRLTLTVTDVRVQRLQDISEADAIAEGCRPFFDESDQRPVPSPNGGAIMMMPLKGPLDSFRDLWNSINGPDAWGENPWVAAYTFTIRKGNIDNDRD